MIPGMGTRIAYIEKVEAKAAAQAARIVELEAALRRIDDGCCDRLTGG